MNYSSVDDRAETLYAPTEITKIGDTYYIVDCWHHRILACDSLDPALKAWTTLPGTIRGGHSIAGEDCALLADNTEMDELLCFKHEDGHFELYHTINIRPYLSNIHGGNVVRRGRPHSVLYDKENGCFIVAVSRADCLIQLRVKNGTLEVCRVLSIPEFQNAYLKFIRKINGDYWVAASEALIRFRIDGDGIRVVRRYALPPYIKSEMINDFAKIGGKYYLTTCEIYGLWRLDELSSDVCGFLHATNIGKGLGIKGTPYRISEFDGFAWITEIQEAQRVSRYQIRNGLLEPKGTLFSF